MNPLSNYKLSRKQVSTIFALILLIILMIVFIAYRLSQNQVEENKNPQESIENTMLYGKVIELNDPNNIPIGDKKLMVPEGWQTTTVYQNTDNSKFKCNDVKDCYIYVVSNNDDQFYISVPDKLVVTSTPEISLDSKVVTINGEEVTFDYQQLVLQQRTDSNSNPMDYSGQPIYFQVYACFKEGFCVNTLQLNIESYEANSKQLSTFEEFVKQIKI